MAESYSDRARQVGTDDDGQPVYERVAICKRCGAEIVWALTQRGKRMPVDPTASLDRGVVQVDTSGRPWRVVRVFPEWRASQMRADGIELHNAHFDTCPKLAAKREREEKRRQRELAKKDEPPPVDLTPPEPEQTTLI